MHIQNQEMHKLIVFFVFNYVFDWNNVILLEDIVSGKRKKTNSTISLFESQGVALEDIAIGFRLFQKANKENVGLELN